MYIPTNQEQLKVITHKKPSAFLRRSRNDSGCLKLLLLAQFSGSLLIRPRYPTKILEENIMIATPDTVAGVTRPGPWPRASAPGMAQTTAPKKNNALSQVMN